MKFESLGGSQGPEKPEFLEDLRGFEGQEGLEASESSGGLVWFRSWQLRKRHHFWWASQTNFSPSYFVIVYNI